MYAVQSHAVAQALLMVDHLSNQCLHAFEKCRGDLSTAVSSSQSQINPV
jgi:hypothetical protein